MSPKSTIFKVTLQIADLTRQYYGSHQLTLARHPSETDERLMIRLLAFALHAQEGLVFANGLTAEDEPDLWQKDLRGDIQLWVDVGLPDERQLRRACGRAQQVVLYIYGGRSAALWWQQNSSQLVRFSNLKVIQVPAATSQALARMAHRHMDLNCTIQDGQVWLADKDTAIEAALTLMQSEQIS